MGHKPSNNYQSDRPESGGANKDGIRENGGLLDRDKEKFAIDNAKKRMGDEEGEAGKNNGSDRESRN